MKMKRFISVFIAISLTFNAYGFYNKITINNGAKFELKYWMEDLNGTPIFFADNYEGVIKANATVTIIIKQNSFKEGYNEVRIMGLFNDGGEKHGRDQKVRVNTHNLLKQTKLIMKKIYGYDPHTIYRAGGKTFMLTNVYGFARHVSGELKINIDATGHMHPNYDHAKKG